MNEIDWLRKFTAHSGNSIALAIKFLMSTAKTKLVTCAESISPKEKPLNKVFEKQLDFYTRNEKIRHSPDKNSHESVTTASTQRLTAAGAIQKTQNFRGENKLELLRLEVEYFFESENKKTQQASRTFLGAGEKILSGIVKVITNGSAVKSSIYNEVVTLSSGSVVTANPSMLDSISQAIGQAIRETMWNRAENGVTSKPNLNIPVSAAGKPASKISSLDAKLAGKPWVSHVYDSKDSFDGSVNPVDVAVDDVMAEGISKLKAKL
ncbi:hypothetical protein HK100_003048 [Physocladia obscura]|uniref:Uncharacterized protein n=1 Tax=Physocladia obscura TaxID=109957 RepID=A0AAD5XAN2_9FUNG|nr:hypothetical protein HK100_003048 [Physocladia obscura]